jgi:hypothetical protein
VEKISTVQAFGKEIFKGQSAEPGFLPAGVPRVQKESRCPRFSGEFLGDAQVLLPKHMAPGLSLAQRERISIR